MAEWNTRRLDDLEGGRVPLGGREFVKAVLEKDEAAVLVVLAGFADGRKVIPNASEWPPGVRGRGSCAGPPAH